MKVSRSEYSPDDDDLNDTVCLSCRWRAERDYQNRRRHWGTQETKTHEVDWETGRGSHGTGK